MHSFIGFYWYFVDKELTEKFGLHVHVYLLQRIPCEHTVTIEYAYINIYSLSHPIYEYISHRFVEVMSTIHTMGLVIKEKASTTVENPGQQCFPLFSFIKALDFPRVNLLR